MKGKTRRVVLSLVVGASWAAMTSQVFACIDFVGCEDVVREHVRAEVAGWCADPSIGVAIECAAEHTELRLVDGDAVSEARVGTDSLTPDTAARVIALVLSELRREVRRRNPADELAGAEPPSPARDAVPEGPRVSSPLGGTEPESAELESSELESAELDAPAAEERSRSSDSATVRDDAVSHPSTAARAGLWPRQTAVSRRWLVGGVLSRHLAASWLAGLEATVEIGPLSVFGTFVTGARTVAQGELRASAVRGGVGAAVVTLQRGILFGFVEPRLSLGWVGVKAASNEAWRGVASSTWTWEAGLGVGLGLGLRRFAVRLLGEFGWSRGLRATDSAGEVVADLHGWVGRLGLHVADGGGG